MNYPAIVLVECAIMANGEVLHFGKTIGWASPKQLDLLDSGAYKMARGKEPIVSLEKNPA